MKIRKLVESIPGEMDVTLSVDDLEYIGFNWLNTADIFEPGYYVKKTSQARDKIKSIWVKVDLEALWLNGVMLYDEATDCMKITDKIDYVVDNNLDGIIRIILKDNDGNSDYGVHIANRAEFIPAFKKQVLKDLADTVKKRQNSDSDILSYKRGYCDNMLPINSTPGDKNPGFTGSNI